MSVVIKYGDVAIGAKEKFSLFSADQARISKLNQIKEYFSHFPNYGNPLEKYSVALDGSVLPLPSNTDAIAVGWWSEQMTDSSCKFVTPIILEMIADEYFTSSAIAITFDQPKNIYCDNLNIKWFRDGGLLAEKDFNPIKPKYECEQKVEFYNKVVITFRSLNAPYNRLHVKNIEHGALSFFYGENIKNCVISKKASLIGSEIPIGTGTLDLIVGKNANYTFQKRQPISVYSNDVLQSTLFVKNAVQKSHNVWNIQAEDYVGLLEGANYKGGMYNGANAKQVLIDIFNEAKVPYEISPDINALTITGYIPYTNCRNALKQVIFAIGAVVNTSSADSVKVVLLDDFVSQTIEKNRIFQGVSVTEKTRVTSVVVSAHSYNEIAETTRAYDASKNGVGTDIFVKFNQPLHSLTIINGVIKEYGANYAIIDADTGCVLNGCKYEHNVFTKTLKNKLVLATDAENIINVSSATLVNQNNIDKVLEICYNYYSKNKHLKAKIVDRKIIGGGDIIRYGEGFAYGSFKYRDKSPKTIKYDLPIDLYDLVTINTEEYGKFEGRVESIDYGLNGNNISKNVLIKEK